MCLIQKKRKKESVDTKKKILPKLSKNKLVRKYLNEQIHKNLYLFLL